MYIHIKIVLTWVIYNRQIQKDGKQNRSYRGQEGWNELLLMSRASKRTENGTQHILVHSSVIHKSGTVALSITDEWIK